MKERKKLCLFHGVLLLEIIIARKKKDRYLHNIKMGVICTLV
jgi:hypothetical protein